MLAALTMAAWSVSARDWVRAGGEGGREVLLHHMADAFSAVPAGLELTA